VSDSDADCFVLCEVKAPPRKFVQKVITFLPFTNDKLTLSKREKVPLFQYYLLAISDFV